MRSFTRRLERVSAAVSASSEHHCQTCRYWGDTLYVDDITGRESPPAICPACGRDRPATRVVRRYGFDPDGFDEPDDSA